MTDVFITEGKFGHRHRHGGKTVVERQSKATVSPETPGAIRAGRGKERSSPRGLEGVGTCQHLDFWLAASRTLR